MSREFPEPVPPDPGPSAVNGSPTRPLSPARRPSPRPGEPASPALVGEAVPAVEQLLCRKPVVWHVGRSPANQVVSHGGRGEKSRALEHHAAEACSVRAAPIYSSLSSLRPARRRRQDAARKAGLGRIWGGVGGRWRMRTTYARSQRIGLFRVAAPSRKTLAHLINRHGFASTVPPICSQIKRRCSLAC